MRVLAYGEILWDIIEENEHLGGAPLNFSAHIAQLGGEASIISSVGEDDLGVRALNRLEDLSVNTEFVQRSSQKSTGTVKVELLNGQPAYEIIKDVAYDHIDFASIKKSSLADFDTFYFGTLIQRNGKSRSSLYQLLEEYSFKNVFCDLNLRNGCYTAESIISSLNYCTILKLNDEEVEIVSKLIFDKELSFSGFWNHINERFPDIKTMVITQGKDGCIAYSENQEVKVASEPCVVKDTIGAGDSFSATFLFSHLKGDNLNVALQNANKVGAYVASSEGAIPKLPSYFLQDLDIGIL